MRWMVKVLGWVGILGLSAGLVGCPVASRPDACTTDADCPAGQGCESELCRPVECRTTGDCDANQVCNDHICVDGDDCSSDGQCSLGQICEAGLCRPGCRSDADCGPDVCDPLGLTCVDCLQSADCELGELCDQGACLPGCSGDRDCPAGMSCYENEPPNGLCAECLLDGDCLAGQRCIAHLCEVTCGDDGDCGAGEVCEAGGCRAGCRDDPGCPGGRCDLDSWACVECLGVDDCVLGQLCIDMACTPGCKTDRDCPDGLICLQDEPPHGLCTECVDPEDCPDFGPRACIAPLAMDFGSVPLGQPRDLTFSIASCGLTDLTISEVIFNQASSADFSLPSPPSTPRVLSVGQVLQVQVRYDPDQSGADSGRVDIYSDDMDANPGTGFTGTVVLSGRSDAFYCDLEVSPALVDFGVVPVGQSEQLGLGLSNLGNQDCVLDLVTIGHNTPNDEFDLVLPVDPGAIIAPGGFLDVTVAYSPTGPGQDTGRLDILCNDKDGAEIAVDLVGFGQPAQDGPVAVCTVSPISAPTLGSLTWHGDQSYDPAWDIIGWSWSPVSFPEGSTASLAAGPSASDRATATDLAGDYTAALVVTNELAQTSQPCTTTASVIPDQDIWIEMFWQHAGDDMDLHLLAPGGLKRSNTDCYFGNCVSAAGLEWGQVGVTIDNPRLALDDIAGTGPEIIYLPSPTAGVYTVFVHDYPGSNYTSPNPVTVNVWIRGIKVETFQNAISGEDFDWDVCLIDWPSGSVTAL